MTPPNTETSACLHLERLWQLLPALARLPASARVDQAAHARQCAGLAWAATGSAEWLLAGLFHDIGKLADRQAHAAASAAMLVPLLGAEALWVVRHHEDFMAAYAPPGVPVDRFARLRHRAEPWYASACRFADEWDCRAFEPAGGLALETAWPLLDTHARALDRAAASRPVRATVEAAP